MWSGLSSMLIFLPLFTDSRSGFVDEMFIKGGLHHLILLFSKVQHYSISMNQDIIDRARVAHSVVDVGSLLNSGRRALYNE